MVTSDIAASLDIRADKYRPIHNRHWELARYELPVHEYERKVGNRYIVEITVDDNEKLAYVHRFTGKRVEFTRQRVDNMTAALEEATAKWECELAIAEANKREKQSNIVGFIDPATFRTTARIVDEWHQKAKDPSWCKWPTNLEGVPGAFGARR